MGAQQAYHWAAVFPGAVDRIVVNCGSARTSVHNRVFLAGLMSTLEAAPEYQGNGRFSATPTAALRSFARVYAGWGLSQDFYRADLHIRELGAPDLETFLRTEWEGRFSQRDAADLYAQLQTWSASDISANEIYDGDLGAALKAIRAHVLLMPSASDLYFRVADNELDVPYLRNAKLLPIPSIWGHRAGNPAQCKTDMEFIRAAVRKFLDI
jgi:homoserine O-acetyltransferase